MACWEPVCLDDFQKYARSSLPRSVFDFIHSGADDEICVQDNTEAFRRYRLLPRILVNVSQRDLSTTVLGNRLSFPVGIAPTGLSKIIHPDGDVCLARGAAAAGTASIVSNYCTSTLEEITAAASDGLHFMQIYMLRERQKIVEVVQKAEKCGFRALFLTLDAPVIGKRRKNLENKFCIPPHVKLPNIPLSKVPTGDGGSVPFNALLARNLHDSSFTWDDLSWLISLTKLPVVLKGILTPEDAVKAVERGVAGIVVSNHGGRQLDSAPASIDALGNIVKAVNGRCEVYMDGGVRTGSDVFKALALGARAVFIGRPAMFGLAYNGEDGVRMALEILREEFSCTMALMGCATVNDIKPGMVVPKTHFSHSKL